MSDQLPISLLPWRPFSRPSRLGAVLAALGCFFVAGTCALFAEEDAVRLPTRAEAAHPTSRGDRTASVRRSAQPVATETAGPVISHTRPGPWGELDYFTVYLEASISALKNMDLQTYETLWKFVGYTDDQVAKLFESVKMPAEIQAELLNRKNWRHEEKTIVVLPSREALLRLSPETRSAIYHVLGRWEDNPFHHEPNVIVGHDVRAWLQRSELPEEILATIEKTVYQRSNNLVFADTPLILRMVKTDDERLKIRKALSRTPTLVVKLKLTPQTDIAKIAEYWGSSTRTKDVEPFLESIAEIPGVNTVDIIHLLPTGVRRLLYTFPNANHGRTGYYPDCHWSSLNFANFEPLERLGDPALATAYTLENYARVPAGQPYRLGDVLFFMDGTSGNAIHSCVYLADDIVYTKNGRSPTQPWVLMKLEDVLSFYAMFYQPQLACYRRKSE